MDIDEVNKSVIEKLTLFETEHYDEQKVAGKVAARARIGMETYGKSMLREDIGTEAWLLHLQEELLDAAVYLERILRDVRKLKETISGK